MIIGVFRLGAWKFPDGASGHSAAPTAKVLDEARKRLRVSLLFEGESQRRRGPRGSERFARSRP